MRGYIAFSHTPDSGFKIGDTIVAAHVVRLFCQNCPHDEWILTLNPQNELNFCFEQVCKDHNIRVLHDVWQPGDINHLNRCMAERRSSRMVHEFSFNTYKEIYRRTDGGAKQIGLCGAEKGLNRKNIFEYYFFGQEQAPDECKGGDRFTSASLGWQWTPEAPSRSVFVAPHAYSQGNGVFTMDYWREVINRLLIAGIAVTVNTPNQGLFGVHPSLTYSYHEGPIRGLFDQIARQQLVLCGNTGIGWIAAAHGVPLIAGQPKFFWFLDYRYDWCGAQSVVDIFGKDSGAERNGSNFVAPDPQEPVGMVLRFWEKHQ